MYEYKRGRERWLGIKKLLCNTNFFLDPPPEIMHYVCNRTNKHNCVKKSVAKCKIKILQNKEQPKFNIKFKLKLASIFYYTPNFLFYYISLLI